MCFDKNCQVNMWPVKPEMDIWSKEPQSSFKKKSVPLCSDKNCQSTGCYKKKNPVKLGSMCFDKKLSRNQIYLYVDTEARNKKNQVICDYPNWQWNNLLTSSIKTAGTVNLPNVCK